MLWLCVAVSSTGKERVVHFMTEKYCVAQEQVVIVYKMIFVPIGCDCTCARMLKHLGLRRFSLPFDWVVTYRGVADILENDFATFLPASGKGVVNHRDGVLFFHNDFPTDTDTIKRRIDRFRTLLQTSQERLVFVRVGHGSSHHHEYRTSVHNEHTDVVDEIEHATRLDKLLKERFPNLSYDIVLLWNCTQCPCPIETLSDEHLTIGSTVRVYNLTSQPERISSWNNMTAFHQFCETILLPLATPDDK